MNEYLEAKVKEFVGMDIQEPLCLAAGNCEMDVLESYKKKREEKEAEIRKLFKIANKL